MGLEGLPRSPLVIMGHMDLHLSTFTQDGFWGTALVSFGHIGTYGPALEYLHPGWVLRDCPGPLQSYWDIWTCIRVPSPRMGFEGLPRSPSVIMGHMDMNSSTFSQDGFWGPDLVRFGYIGTYGPALEYLHPKWVFSLCPDLLWWYWNITTHNWLPAYFYIQRGAYQCQSDLIDIGRVNEWNVRHEQGVHKHTILFECLCTHSHDNRKLMPYLGVK